MPRAMPPPDHMENPVPCPACGSVDGCLQCTFWGFVELDGPDSGCVHDFAWRTADHLQHELTCRHCKTRRTVDSS